jgi:hypothetical protein
MNRLLIAAALLFAPEGETGGGGGTPPAPTGEPPPKTFTQDEVNAFLAKEKKRFGDYDALKAGAAKATELEQQLAKLHEERELAGKSADEKARIEGERAKKRMDDERAVISKERDDAKALAVSRDIRLKTTITRTELSAGLVGAKVYPDSLGDAVTLMAAASKVEIVEDEDGNASIASIVLGGITYKTAREAAEAFLKTKPYFASAGGGGAGTPRPNGGGAMPKDLSSLPADQLATLAANDLKS